MRISLSRAQSFNALIGTIFAGLSVWLTLVELRQAEDIASRSGAFDKPALGVSLGACAFDERAPTHVVFGASFDKDTVYAVSIPLVVRNESARTIERASLTFRYPSVGRFAVPSELLTVESAGDISSLSLDRTTSTLGTYDYVSFSLTNLDPGKTVGLRELVHLAESRVEGSFKASGSTWRYSVDLAFEATLTVGGVDMPTVDYQLKVSGVAATSMGELKAKLAERVTDESRRLRQRLPWWRYALLVPGSRLDWRLCCCRPSERSCLPPGGW